MTQLHEKPDSFPEMDEIVIPLDVVLKMVNGLCSDCQKKVRQYIVDHQFNIGKPVQEQISGIMHSVSLGTGITIQEMRGTKVHPRIVSARRQVALTARRFGITYEKIAEALDKHHTSIIHLVKTSNYAQEKISNIR